MTDDIDFTFLTNFQSMRLSSDETNDIIDHKSGQYITENGEKFRYSAKKHEEIVKYVKAITGPKKILYTRVSSEGPHEMHISLEMQEEFCTKNNPDLIVISEGKCSAFKNKQKIILEIIELLICGDELHVYDITRFSRNYYNSLLFSDSVIDKGAIIVSHLDAFNHIGTPQTRKVFLKLAIDAAAEVDCMSFRARQNIMFLKKKGNAVGRIPYGFDRTIVSGIRVNIENKDEKKIIKKIVNGHKSGIPIKAILADLKALGKKYRKKEFTTKNINYILKRNKEKSDSKTSTVLDTN